MDISSDVIHPENTDYRDNLLFRHYAVITR